VENQKIYDLATSRYYSLFGIIWNPNQVIFLSNQEALSKENAANDIKFILPKFMKKFASPVIRVTRLDTSNCW
jgi:hypothetical protein